MVVDMSPPSLQLASLLNKATFLFQSTFISQVLVFKQQTAESDFSNTINIQQIVINEIIN